MILNLKRRLVQKIKTRVLRTHHTLEIVRPGKEALDIFAANNYLAQYASNITSQGGEDGVIEKIIETIGLKSPGWCVEFGACDGKRDSNTWNLVKNKGWKAVYIEPDPNFFKALEQHCKDTPDTWCFNEFVSWEGNNSLDAILARTPIPADFDLMVVDIDGADFYVWQACKHYRPQVICIEFHRLIHPDIYFVPAQNVAWNRPSSLRALYELAKQKGYELVGIINWNAFFVRKEHFAKFAIRDNSPKAMYYAAEEMRIFQGYDGTLFLCGINQHYWKYQCNEVGISTNVKISHNDIQVLPEGLRIFRPRHTYRSATLEAQAGKLDENNAKSNQLLKYRRNVASENGEDGILEHIFSIIGVSNKFAVDIGACDGNKWSNTRHLIANEGWQGLLIESEKDAFTQLFELYKNNKKIQCVNTHVTSSTFESILRKYKVPKNFSFLTIDIEGNDYHLFACLNTYRPAVICIDFNPSISNDIRFIQKNDEAVHYGASLRAIIELADSKEYDLTAVTDWNAIFVRRDLFSKLGITNNSIDTMYTPPFEMRMFQTMDGCMHLEGCKTLVRQDYIIDWEDFQVLPQKLRGADNSAEGFGKASTIFYR